MSTLRLPTEMMTRIFDMVDISSLAQCRLVCQSWNPLAERAMLVQPIVLESNSEAEALYSLLSRKPSYGKLIKYLYIEDFDAKRPEVYLKLLPLAFTPGIKEFEGEVDCPELFRKMVDLAKNSTSKFQELVSIPHPPRICSEEYYNALFCFKDILQKVLIRFHFNYPTRWDFLDRFDEMKSLVSLTLTGYSFFLEQLESLLNKCSQSQHLEIDAFQSCDDFGRKLSQEWCAENSQKTHILKKLKVNGSLRPSLVEFLVYKYPDVEQVELLVADEVFYEKEEEFDSDDEVYPGDYEYMEHETCDLEDIITAFKAYPTYRIEYFSDLND